jgi:riboflavin synthase
MFTGIIEAESRLVGLKKDGTNLQMEFQCEFSHELKVDQSLSHNGVCLTVTEVSTDSYQVTAIDETLSRTNLGSLKIGDRVNVERCLKLGGRLDGHMVQGHVDCTGQCVQVNEKDGSWSFVFSFPEAYSKYVVAKGSICVNGVSLTVVEAGLGSFSVAIIPYTYDHTNFKDMIVGSPVNLEFDIIGKYIERMLALR